MQLSSMKFRKSIILGTKKWIKSFPAKIPVGKIWRHHLVGDISIISLGGRASADQLRVRRRWHWQLEFASLSNHGTQQPKATYQPESP